MTQDQFNRGMLRMMVLGGTAALCAVLLNAAMEGYAGIVALYGIGIGGASLIVAGVVILMLFRSMYKWIYHEFEKDELTKKS